MQSEGKKAPGEPKKYANAFKAYGIIARWACSENVIQCFEPLSTHYSMLGRRTHRAHIRLVVAARARVLCSQGDANIAAIVWPTLPEN